MIELPLLGKLPNFFIEELRSVVGYEHSRNPVTCKMHFQLRNYSLSCPLANLTHFKVVCSVVIQSSIRKGCCPNSNEQVSCNLFLGGERGVRADSALREPVLVGRSGRYCIVRQSHEFQRIFLANTKSPGRAEQSLQCLCGCYGSDSTCPS